MRQIVLWLALMGVQLQAALPMASASCIDLFVRSPAPLSGIEISPSVLERWKRSPDPVWQEFYEFLLDPSPGKKTFNAMPDSSNETQFQFTIKKKISPLGRQLEWVIEQVDFSNVPIGYRHPKIHFEFLYLVGVIHSAALSLQNTPLDFDSLMIRGNNIKNRASERVLMMSGFEKAVNPQSRKLGLTAITLAIPTALMNSSNLSDSGMGFKALGGIGFVSAVFVLTRSIQLLRNIDYVRVLPLNTPDVTTQ